MKNEPVVSPILYSRQQAATALGISSRSVDLLVADGRLASTRIGRRVMLPVSAVENLAAEGTRGGFIKSSN